jgi:hypothetical protein
MEGHPDRTEATESLLALRSALIRYQRNPSSVVLDEAFAAAAAEIAVMRGTACRLPADADEARRLMSQVPDFEQLVSVAVGAAERSARAAAGELWKWFGLASTPPSWDENERSGARVLIACACAPLDARGASWLGPRLLRMAAHRWSAILVAELCAGDDVLWRRALGERYDSVHKRYAPRSRWRTHELSELLATNAQTVDALRDRLTRWLSEGGDFASLPSELEAAIVLTRTPDHLA